MVRKAGLQHGRGRKVRRRRSSSRLIIFNLAIALALSFLSFVRIEFVFAAITPGYIEEVKNYGRIDWSQGVITASGIGNPRVRRSVLETMAEARGAAFSNLFEAIKAVSVNSSSSVRDLFANKRTLDSQFQHIMESAQIVKRVFWSDGTVELTLALNITRGFAQLVLPDEIEQIEQVKTIGIDTSQAERMGSKAAKLSISAKRDHKGQVDEVVTGIILDARGLGGRPAMAPRILDETGEEAYGPSYVTREYAVQRAMAFYTRSMEAPGLSERVGSNPMIVRALRADGIKRCDFIISNADASTVRGASDNLSFLKQCKVAIVLDK